MIPTTVIATLPVTASRHMGNPGYRDVSRHAKLRAIAGQTANWGAELIQWIKAAPLTAEAFAPFGSVIEKRAVPDILNQ